jgi:hypothetical protein
MADLSYLFGGTTPASARETLSETSSSLPAWLQEYTRGLAGQATAVAGSKYQPYIAPTDVSNYGTGTRIAGFDPAQTQAYNQITQNVGNYQPFLSYSAQTVPQAVGNYMNPYTDSVVNRIAELGQRNLTENLLPQVNSTFVGAGQFGSTRNADFINRALRDANESILGQQAAALQAGFQNAQQTALNDMIRYAQLGNLMQQLGFHDASMLDTIGAQRQGLNQKSMDLAYNDFLQQRDYQKNQLSFLSDIIRGQQVPVSQYSTTSVVPGTTNQLSPLAAAAQGFLGAKTLTSAATK